MWLFLNNAFVSAVEHMDSPDLIVLRARAKGDISRFIGVEVEETETPRADYRYRIIIKREEFAKVLATLATRIDYTNFKNSVKAWDRHAAYTGVWHEMFDFQKRRLSPYVETISPARSAVQQALAIMEGRDAPRAKKRRRPRKKA